MADTDLPNGFGAIDRPSGPSRPPRPIASPFGMLVNPWPTPDPNQVPGFNVQPPAPAQTNPMASLLDRYFRLDALSSHPMENRCYYARQAKFK